MARDVANPYAQVDLFVSSSFHQRLLDFVGRSDSESFAVSRQVDLWWVAFCIGVVQNRREPLLPGAQRTKFNDASILSSDPWRITHLELLALAEEGVEALQNPGQVIRIASEYANGGMSWVLHELTAESVAAVALLQSIADLVA